MAGLGPWYVVSKVGRYPLHQSIALDLGVDPTNAQGLGAFGCIHEDAIFGVGVSRWGQQGDRTGLALTSEGGCVVRDGCH